MTGKGKVKIKKSKNQKINTLQAINNAPKKL